MSFLHSSALPRYAPIPKTVNGKTHTDEKAARDAVEAKAERECYRAVDQRDGLRCRVTGVRLTLGGSLTKRVHRHHMVKRSQKRGHDTRDVITVSPAVHDDIHVRGVLRLTGHASLRDVTGKLCGVKVERLADGRWTAVGMV